MQTQYPRSLFLLSFVGCSMVLFMGMGQDSPDAEGNNPKFAALQEGEPNIRGSVVDESKEYELSAISFSGKTNLGVRSEDNDSNVELNLADLASIKIEHSAFRSERYPNNAFVLASCAYHDGKTRENLLIPENLVVCGLENGRTKISWFIKSVDAIHIHEFKRTLPMSTGTKPKPVTEQKKTTFVKMKEKAGELVSTVVTKTGQVMRTVATKASELVSGTPEEK